MQQCVRLHARARPGAASELLKFKEALRFQAYVNMYCRLSAVMLGCSAKLLPLSFALGIQHSRPRLP